MVYIMYLEISGRRTGKTTRLCKDVVKHLDSKPSAIACIVMINGAMHHHFKRLIPDEYHDRVILAVNFKKVVETVVRLNTLSLSHMFKESRLGSTLGSSTELFSDVKFYFDEFDFMDIENVPVLENAYYVTTRNDLRTMDDWLFWRKDKLLRLLVANDFMYTQRHGMACMIDGEARLDAVWRCMDTKTFQQEYLTGIDKAKWTTDYFDRSAFPPEIVKGIFEQIKRQK